MDTLVNQMAAIPTPSPKNASYMSAATKATKLYLQDMPIIMMVAENWIVPYSTKYWTGWPTKKNPYEAPFPSWEGWNVILHTLKPAK
jgi:peptide/nickel transport system substrate-binding protein